MRLPSVLLPTDLPLAELCAARLDGDGFPLGDALIAADEPDGPAQRAASVAADALRYGLVLGGWTAAWIHGATEVLHRPLDLQTDRDGGRRTKSVRIRQVVLGAHDVRVLGGVPVTAPFRTATDLARLEPRLTGELVATLGALLAAAGLSWPQAVGALAAAPAAPGRRRAQERFRVLRDGRQPAETR